MQQVQQGSVAEMVAGQNKDKVIIDRRIIKSDLRNNLFNKVYSRNAMA